MLTLTSNAAQVIRSLQSGSELPDGAGLRIATRPEEDVTSLQLAMAAAPTGDDEVVEAQGARVFLENSAASMLEQMILDAEVDDKGSVQFFLGNQPGAEEPSPDGRAG